MIYFFSAKLKFITVITMSVDSCIIFIPTSRHLQIADRKIVNSWSVEAKERFTCPVVHHDESFFGVRDDEVC